MLHCSTEPEMLGGLKLHIGDQLIDGSVATRLRRLRQELINSGSIDIRKNIDRIIEEGGAA